VEAKLVSASRVLPGFTSAAQFRLEESDHQRAQRLRKSFAHEALAA
jgi:hypothetical protein